MTICRPLRQGVAKRFKSKYKCDTTKGNMDYPIRDGLYIVRRHADLIAAGRKTLIVKARKFDVSGKRFYLITEQEVLGEIVLSDRRSISLKQFEALTDEHLITSAERELWWPGKRKFWAYRILNFKRFDPPLRYERKKGVQVFQRNVQPFEGAIRKLF